jgi:2-polyprenyl-3-methyl-5-hydroxy-6-metoxy-1,4-benzoquinol methylase
MGATLSAARYETELGESGRNWVFVQLAAKGRRVLETGCSTGFLSRHLVERGCTVTGVEVDHEAAEQARRWCERVVVADLNQSDWVARVGGSYDTILFGDVLEHLVDPEGTLRRAAEVLDPKGRIIICLPNIAHWTIRANLLRGKFEYTSTGILDVTHLRFFTPETARQMIQNAGYRITSTHPIMGGGRIGKHIRALFPGLFTKQIIFVTELAAG